MGKWFPGIRTGTPEQVRAHREAIKNLHRNGLYEYKAGIREETEHFHRLNDAVLRTERPLSPTQRRWHFDRAGAELDREMDGLQRAADRQDRERRAQQRQGRKGRSR